MIEAPSFVPFPKIPRLNRDMVVTEKLDGTSGVITISETGEPFVYRSGQEVPFLVGSRTRWIQPENDNFGFALWAYDNRDSLLKLGPGTHYGEWWGRKIGRGYGLANRRFSLFNVSRWTPEAIRQIGHPEICAVPVMYSGPFSQLTVTSCLSELRACGSSAAPGFMDPEGVVVYHVAAGQLFKVTLKNDEKPKGQA